MQEKLTSRVLPVIDLRGHFLLGSAISILPVITDHSHITVALGQFVIIVVPLMGHERSHIQVFRKCYEGRNLLMKSTGMLKSLQIFRKKVMINYNDQYKTFIIINN